MVFLVSVGSEGARQESRKIENFLQTLMLSISAICFYIIIKIFYLLTNFIGVDRERWQFSNILAYCQNFSVENEISQILYLIKTESTKCCRIVSLEFNIFLILNIYSKMVMYFNFYFKIQFLLDFWEKFWKLSKAGGQIPHTHLYPPLVKRKLPTIS